MKSLPENLAGDINYDIRYYQFPNFRYQIGENTYEKYLPKETFDDENLESIITEIETTQKYSHYLFGNHIIRDYLKFSAGNYQKIRIPWDDNRTCVFGTENFPSEWIAFTEGEYIPLYTYEGLLTGKFFDTFFYLGETCGTIQHIYNNKWIDTITCSAAENVRLITELDNGEVNFIKFALSCAKRAIQYAGHDVDDVYWEILELVESFIPIFKEYTNETKMDINELTEIWREAFKSPKSRMNLPSLDRYLQENYPLISKKYRSLRSKALDVENNHRSHKPYEVSIATTLVRLESTSELLRFPANWAAGQRAISFENELKEKGHRLPTIFHRDPQKRVQAVRLWHAGQKLEFEWQAKTFLKIFGILQEDDSIT